jgi:hypothetical protein
VRKEPGARSQEYAGRCFFKIPGRLVEASGVLRLLNSEFRILNSGS